MSKIIYLLGAGASYGKRENNELVRGVPIVEEFVDQLGRVIQTTNDSFIQQELSWLQTICKKYPTVDTYASILYKRSNKSYESNEEYTRLKKAIALFLSLIQKPETRDERYDLFFAAITQEKAQLPDEVTILSWNYDSQLEFAYSEYVPSVQDMNILWKKHLNVYNKTSLLQADHRKFGVVKLNGTALWCDPKENKIWDIYLNPNIATCSTQVLSQSCQFDISNMVTGLSFSWEKNDTLLEYIRKIAIDTEVVVVVGYSFPDVNRLIDKHIFGYMPKIKKVYIQDKKPFEVADNLKFIIDPAQFKINNITIEPTKYVDKFIIPRELL